MLVLKTKTPRFPPFWVLARSGHTAQPNIVQLDSGGGHIHYPGSWPPESNLEVIGRSKQTDFYLD